MMKRILEQLNEAYLMLSTIPVQGDSVDVMAAAKTVLRKAAGELKEMDAEAGAAGGNTAAGAPVEADGRTHRCAPTERDGRTDGPPRAAAPTERDEEKWNSRQRIAALLGKGCGACDDVAAGASPRPTEKGAGDEP